MGDENADNSMWSKIRRGLRRLGDYKEETKIDALTTEQRCALQGKERLNDLSIIGVVPGGAGSSPYGNAVAGYASLIAFEGYNKCMAESANQAAVIAPAGPRTGKSAEIKSSLNQIR